MSDEVILREVRDRVLVVTLNRPEAGNAITNAVMDGMIDALDALEADPALQVGVLTGAGKGFCAGIDLKAFATEGAPRRLLDFVRRGSTKPLVAAVEGYALAGGLEVALTCDLVVAARGAKLGIPEVRVGLVAAGGALLRLPRRLPPAIAAEMAFTASPITAEQAHAHGLVNRVVEPSTALAEAVELAGAIARNAPLALAATKRILRETEGIPEDDAWRIQHPITGPVFASADAKEGARAFAQKRAADWKGV